MNDNLKISYPTDNHLVGFVPKLVDHGNAASAFDAIYVCTRGRPEYLDYLLNLELDLATKHFFLVPTSDDCLPKTLAKGRKSLLKEFLSFKDQLGLSTTSFDLGQKRNFSIEHARKNGFNKIALVDDDIRLNSYPNDLILMADGLDDWSVVAAIPNDFPDLSVAGHLAVSLGITKQVNPSGSCCALKIGSINPYFCNLYNEDHLAFVEAIAGGRFASGPDVKQLPYDPFENLQTVRFQELGEIISDSILEALKKELRTKPLSATSSSTINSLAQKIDWGNEIKKRQRWWGDVKRLTGKVGRNAKVACFGYDTCMSIDEQTIRYEVGVWLAENAKRRLK